MERRNFIRLLTFGAVGGAAPSVALAHKMPEVSDPVKDGPICSEVFNIQSGTKKKPTPKKKNNTQLSLYLDEYEESKSIGMAVGQDGNLWIKKEDGNWKKVLTE